MASKSIYEVTFNGIPVVLIVWEFQQVLDYCKQNQVAPDSIVRTAYNISIVDLTEASVRDTVGKV